MLLGATRRGLRTQVYSSSSRSVFINSAIAQNPARQQRSRSTVGKPLNPGEIEDLLSKPTWSVSSLTARDANAPPIEAISQKQLHHLLRLSALPLPKSLEQEAEMIETLQSQLHFVRAIQSADTTGVEPLCALRDETEASRKASEVTVASLKDELDREEVVGFARRIRKKSETASSQTETLVDVLKLAPNTIGRYVVVDTQKS